jgi:hypothetical protein
MDAERDAARALLPLLYDEVTAVRIVVRALHGDGDRLADVEIVWRKLRRSVIAIAGTTGGFSRNAIPGPGVGKCLRSRKRWVPTALRPA